MHVDFLLNGKDGCKKSVAASCRLVEHQYYGSILYVVFSEKMNRHEG